MWLLWLLYNDRWTVCVIVSMLSPKMQRTIRVNENQLLNLSERAHYDHSLAGYLHKRTADSTKWQSRWFVLYQVSTSSASLVGQK